jgi:hypothetical protein
MERSKFMKNTRGASLLQVMMIVALTTSAGLGVVKMVEVAGQKQAESNAAKRIDALTQYLALAITNPALCQIAFQFAPAPTQQTALSAGANANNNTPTSYRVSQLSFPRQQSNQQGQTGSAPTGFIDVALNTNNSSELNTQYGINVAHIGLTPQPDGQYEMIIAATPTKGAPFKRRIGTLQLNLANPLIPTCSNVGGTTSLDIACQMMGGFYQVDAAGRSRCVHLAADTKCDNPNEFIVDIKPPDYPGGPQQKICASAAYTCPAGQYLIGINNGQAVCDVVTTPPLAATPTPTPAVNGACGPANGNAYDNAQAVNVAGLCSAGTASPVYVSGSGPWSWQCMGASGGVNCNAKVLSLPSSGPCTICSQFSALDSTIKSRCDSGVIPANAVYPMYTNIYTGANVVLGATNLHALCNVPSNTIPIGACVANTAYNTSGPTGGGGTGDTTCYVNGTRIWRCIGGGCGP